MNTNTTLPEGAICALCAIDEAVTVTTAPVVADPPQLTAADLRARGVHDVKVADVRLATGRLQRRVLRAGVPLCCVCELVVVPVEGGS